MIEKSNAVIIGLSYNWLRFMPKASIQDKSDMQRAKAPLFRQRMSNTQILLSCFRSDIDQSDYNQASGKLGHNDGPWQAASYSDKHGDSYIDIDSDSAFILWLAETSNSKDGTQRSTLIAMLQYEVTNQVINSILNACERYSNYKLSQQQADQEAVETSVPDDLTQAILDQFKAESSQETLDSIEQLTERSRIGTIPERFDDEYLCGEHIQDIHHIFTQLLTNSQIATKIKQLHLTLFSKSKRQHKITRYLDAATAIKEELNAAEAPEVSAQNTLSLFSYGRNHKLSELFSSKLDSLAAITEYSDHSKPYSSNSIQTIICKTLCQISKMQSKDILDLAFVIQHYMSEHLRIESQKIDTLHDIIDKMYIERYLPTQKQVIIQIVNHLLFILNEIQNGEVKQNDLTDDAAMLTKGIGIRFPVIDSETLQLFDTLISNAEVKKHVTDMANNYRNRSSEHGYHLTAFPLVICYEVLLAKTCVNHLYSDSKPKEIIVACVESMRKQSQTLNQFYKESLDPSTKLNTVNLNITIHNEFMQFIRCSEGQQDPVREIQFSQTLKRDITGVISCVIAGMSEWITNDRIEYITGYDSMTRIERESRRESAYTKLKKYISQAIDSKDLAILDTTIMTELISDESTKELILLYIDGIFRETYKSRKSFERWITGSLTNNFYESSKVPSILEQNIVAIYRENQLLQSGWISDIICAPRPSESYMPLRDDSPSNTPSRKKSPGIDEDDGVADPFYTNNYSGKYSPRSAASSL